MRTKELIEELNKLDPDGECIISGLFFAEKVVSYWDGPIFEPVKSEHFPEKYIINYHGGNKILLHFLYPKDFVFEHLCASNGEKTGELVCDCANHFNVEKVVEEARQEYNCSSSC